MNLEKLQLPDFLLADLFKFDVVETKSLPDNTVSLSQPLPVKWFLGENKKNIVILIKDDQSVYLRDEWLGFLTAILGACHLNLGDVAIVNYVKNKFLYAELSEKLAPKYFLSFDVTAQEIELPFIVPNYQVQQYDHCHFLLAPSLETMLADTGPAKLEKSKLWLSLKKIFNV